MSLAHRFRGSSHWELLGAFPVVRGILEHRNVGGLLASRSRLKSSTWIGRIPEWVSVIIIEMRTPRLISQCAWSLLGAGRQHSWFAVHIARYPNTSFSLYCACICRCRLLGLLEWLGVVEGVCKRGEQYAYRDAHLFAPQSCRRHL